MSEHPSSGGAKLPSRSADAGEVVQSRSGDELPIDNLFNSERQQRINARNLDRHNPFRKDSINWILQRRGHYGLSPATAHRAVAYFDRFLSDYSIAAEDDRRYRVLATACLTVAARMQEVEPVLEASEQSFTDPTVEDMELVIMGRFKFDLRWVTPFDFHDYFMSRIPPLYGFRPADHVAVGFTDLVMRTISAGDFVRYLPSEVAAAAVVLVNGRNVKLPAAFYERVDNVRVRSCRRQLEGYLPQPCPCVDCVAWPPPGPVAVHDSTVSTTGNRGAGEGQLKKRRRNLWKKRLFNLWQKKLKKREPDA